MVLLDLLRKGAFSLAHKKKYLIGFYISLLMLFVLLLGALSTCYASVSNESVQYYLDTIYDHSTFSSSYSFKTYLNNYKSNEANITDLTNKINTFLTNSGYENLNERNMICFFYVYDSYFYIYFTFSNCSAPNGYDDLAFLNVSASTFSNYNVGDKILIYRTGIWRNGTILNPTTTVETTSAGTNYTAYNNQINTEISVYTSDNFVGTGLPSVYYNNYPVILKNTYGNFEIEEPEPEIPSGDTSTTGTITNNSGETTGKIDLTNIENGIIDIRNQISGDTQNVINNLNENTNKIINSISGEVGKITSTLTDNADETIDNTIITSGDIESSLGFEIAQDPYSNFWVTLTNNLKTALLGTKRSIDITFQGRTWTISLDEYMVLPSWLIIILIPFSTAFFTWVLVRQWKHIFDKLASGNIDSILKENSEERYF